LMRSTISIAKHRLWGTLQRGRAAGSTVAVRPAWPAAYERPYVALPCLIKTFLTAMRVQPVRAPHGQFNPHQSVCRREDVGLAPHLP
jgi:hypothetical protein